MSQEITPTDWGIITTRIKERRCIPFLGAAVNVSSNGYKGLPLGEQVALSLVREMLGLGNDEDPKDLAEVITHEKLKQGGLDKDLARIALKNLPRVALHAELAARKDYDYFLGRLKAIIAEQDAQPSNLLRLIASLNCKLIITTNYDRLLENAFNDSPYKDKYRCIVQRIEGFNELELAEMNQWLLGFKDPIVYKIHGSFSDEKTTQDRILITEDDYIQFLTVIGKQDEGMPQLVKEKLVDSTLLFLGYGLEDWDFRTLYKGLIEGLPPHDLRASFAIQKNPPDFLREFWAEKHVTIYDLDVHKFAGQLEDQLKKRNIIQ